MQYRKRQTVVDAVQFDGTNAEEIAAFLSYSGAGVIHPDGVQVWNTVVGQELRARIGDWIIKDADGVVYPCDPSIFAATYDPIE